jgi:hypothetical protein
MASPLTRRVRFVLAVLACGLPGCGPTTTEWSLPGPPTWYAAFGHVLREVVCDGVSAPGDPGLGGVTVRISQGGGAFIDDVLTDGDGAFVFAWLSPGVIVVEVPPGQPALGSLVATTPTRVILPVAGDVEVDFLWCVP